MLYGYCRVSTTKQVKGTSLDDQEAQLRDAGAQKIYRESYTGTTDERPELQALLAALRPGDTFMVCKLDRFARNVRDALALVDKLRGAGIVVHILNIGIIDDTPMGRLLFTVLASFAEFERDMIVERTQAGRAIARQQPGYREGRPPLYGREQIAHAMELLDTGHTYRQVTMKTGISKSTLIRARRSRI